MNFAMVVNRKCKMGLQKTWNSITIENGCFFLQCLETDDPQMFNSITNYSVNNLDLFFVCEEYDVAQTPKVCIQHASYWSY